jgi:hypothetical protein
MVVIHFWIEMVFYFPARRSQAGIAFFPLFLSSVCRESGYALSVLRERHEPERMEEVAE